MLWHYQSVQLLLPAAEAVPAGHALQAAWPLLAEQLTERAVLALYAHRGAKGVRRFDLPLLPAFNFVIEDVLEGGVNGSLNLDGHGKSNSYLLLGMKVRVPAKFTRGEEA